MNKKDGPHDHGKPSEKRSISGEVKVHGALQVFETEGATEQRETKRAEDKAYKNATKDYERRSLLTVRITAGITAVYLAVTCLIFVQSKRSADAAASAAKTAAEAERPWLSADIAISGPLVSDKDGAHITMGTRLTNSGHSPAIRMAYRYELFAILGPNDTVKKRDKLCDQLRGESGVSTNAPFLDTIFPAREPVTFPNWVIPMDKDSIDFATGRFGVGMHPTIVFCVAYRSGFSDSQYDTSYVYDVFDRSNPAGVVTLGTTSHPENLVLHLRNAGGIRAD
jgi:hypothetical protein